MSVLSKEFIDIQAIIKCRFALKCICDMIITCSPPVFLCKIHTFLLHYVLKHFLEPLLCLVILHEIKQIILPILSDLTDFSQTAYYSCEKLMYQISGENSLSFVRYRYLIPGPFSASSFSGIVEIYYLASFFPY